jgi:hypothetical protein
MCHHVKYPLSLPDFNTTFKFLDRFFEKYSTTKFHENLTGGSRVLPCGRTGGNDEVAFRNFMNAPTILTLFQTGVVKERTVDNTVKLKTRVINI